MYLSMYVCILRSKHCINVFVYMYVSVYASPCLSLFVSLSWRLGSSSISMDCINNQTSAAKSLPLPQNKPQSRPHGAPTGVDAQRLLAYGLFTAVRKRVSRIPRRKQRKEEERGGKGRKEED